MDADPDLQNLRNFFSDLDPGLVEVVYDECGKDHKAAMQELAELAKNPTAAVARLKASGRAPQSGVDRRPDNTGSSSADVYGTPGLAALSSLPSIGEHSDHGPNAYLPTSWDVNALTDTLANVGSSLTDGISSIATNISGWVADLASAFDSGWQDDDGEDDEQALTPGKKEDRAVVAHGGIEGARQVSHRRGGGASAAAGGSSSMHRVASASTADEEEEDDDDKEA
mmetsp:Transcript_16636/g.35987  ORF Transcript_16636/g.35987 Transcript_16636/m.35987 type:complete len:226 (+) Transcript_16636:154-831(+)|eukprot:CAMPEP_0202911390 /NCGR_PEP_ID=MMETSP1392-20130828/54875_1 /ASSEMBLY_ACC=CAM_ASM_000868 /TAXON_ID=225041 /ORGANISM="Chlamydomonas chlamydogama, Strain SAG 11-48b" /LENGTH=225 /DNA_ID=CAMNT_0049601873 /DNA_START=141 /DNA_END=818 /DNA_ORIENTATION=+